MSLPKKILLIDDDEINNFVVAEWIKDNHLNVHSHIINDASLALEYLEKCTPENFPDLILCDLLMPGFDGYDFLTQYEKLYFHNHPLTRIVIMSANIADKDQVRLSAYRCLTAAMVKQTVQENFKLIKETYLK